MVVEGRRAHLHPGGKVVNAKGRGVIQLQPIDGFDPRRRTGIAFDSSGYRATLELSAALLGVAAVLAFLAARAISREPVTSVDIA